MGFMVSHGHFRYHSREKWDDNNIQGQSPDAIGHAIEGGQRRASYDLLGIMGNMGFR